MLTGLKMRLWGEVDLGVKLWVSVGKLVLCGRINIGSGALRINHFW